MTNLAWLIAAIRSYKDTSKVVDTTLYDIVTHCKKSLKAKCELATTNQERVVLQSKDFEEVYSLESDIVYFYNVPRNDDDVATCLPHIKLKTFNPLRHLHPYNGQRKDFKPSYVYIWYWFS